MSARELTKAELDIVWTLPDGWVWARDMFDEDEGWVWTAELVGSIDTVWVSEGIVGFAGDGPPVEVTIAVCMVALGLDSREAIAAAIVESGDIEEKIGKAAGGTSIVTGMARAAEAYRCAEMVRRGRVKPC